ESFYLADGHHRYETAMQYREWLTAEEGPLPKDHPARYALTGLVPASDKGLIIRPIHRVVARRAPDDWRERLERTFGVEPLDVSPGDTAFEGRVRELMDGPEPVVVALGLAESPLVLRKRPEIDLEPLA